MCMCATPECKQADVPLVVPAFGVFFFLSFFPFLLLPSPSPLALHITLQ